MPDINTSSGESAVSVLEVLEQCARWHNGDKFRESARESEREVWEEHKRLLDNTIAALATQPAAPAEVVAWRNQCEGCATNPRVDRNGDHKMPDGGRMACTAYMYATPPVQAPAAPSVGEPVTRDNIVIGGRYNWKNQPERLVYMGLCEPRNGRWHQFAKVEDPAVCWSEVTDDDLSSFEVTPPAAPAAPSVGEPDDNYDPEIPVTRSLLIAAVHELARYALPAGADDQVIANLSACCGIATPPAAPPATEAPSDLTNAELADHVEVIAAGFAMPEYPQAYRNTMRARLLDAANRLRAPTTAAAVGASDWQAKRDLMDRLDARDAGACIQHVHREWRSALTVAIETLETEREHRSEGGHDADAAKMKRAETILRTMLEATPVQPVPESLSLLAKKHEGMRVDYSGLLGQCQRALRHKGESANAEMLRQLQCHLKELGERWYGGDTDVVDEILQLYCIEKDARAALATTSSAASEVKP